MDDIFEVLKVNDVEIVLLDMKSHGYYNTELKVIFINEKLDEDEQKEAILHELGHVLNHKDLVSLYNIPSYRTKMEYEANKYMITYLINESDGQFNYSNVLENYNLGLGWECNLNKKRPKTARTVSD